MSATVERKPYAYGRNGPITKEEYDAVMAEVNAALEQDDEEALDRILPRLPMDADVMMAFASVCGREFMLECGFDMTEANMKYGEGWLDALKS